MDAQAVEVGRFRHIFVRAAGGSFAAVLAVAALFAAFTVGCNRENASVPGTAGSKPLPDQVISGFSITESARGRKEWKMDAGRASIYEQRNVLDADSVTVTFYDPEGAVRSHLTADRGTLNRRTDDMEADGNVVVTGADGVVLRTQHLTWLAEARQIVSDDSVTVIRRGDVLTGWGFRGDPDLGKFEIQRNMRATIRPSGSGSGESGP